MTDTPKSATPAPAATVPALSFAPSASSLLTNPFSAQKSSDPKKNLFSGGLTLGASDSPFIPKDTKVKAFFDAETAPAPTEPKKVHSQPRPNFLSHLEDLPLKGVHFDRIFPS
jgi:hypothetical protein